MSQTEFEDLEPLTDPETGLVAKISVRSRPGHGRVVSFMIVKEFDRGGRTEQTAWLGRRHVEAALRLTERVRERLDVLEDKIRAEDRASRRAG